jgi:ABC-type nitrate/sulfonate/bicarbonate transport system ATPase subunit
VNPPHIQPYALLFTDQYNRRAARFLKQHPELRSTYLKTLQLLQANPAHPSLRLHDVDEAVLLSDKIVMMTNGPSATIGEVLSVELARPRNRVELAESTQYLHYRKAVIDFLYTRQAHVEKMTA